MDREHETLETYLRIFGWVLLGVCWLPFDFYGADPIWPWEGLPDAQLLEGIAILLPLLLGGFFLVLSRWRRSKPHILLVLAGCALFAWLVEQGARLGSHPFGVYDRLTDGLPPLFARAFWLLQAGMVLLAAGIRLGARGFLPPRSGGGAAADPWPVARALTGAGLLLVVMFYLLPYRGAVPLVELVQGVLEGGTRAGWAWAAGQALAVFPLLLGLLAAGRLWRRAGDSGGLLVALQLGFLPLLSLLVGLRDLGAHAPLTLLHLRSGALLLCVNVGGGLLLPAILRGLWYEVPWNTGRLSRIDRVLARLLAEPGEALAAALRELNPLLRALVRRRLLLWRAAAASEWDSPAAPEAALTDRLRLRWTESRSSGPGGAAEPGGFPRWMRGWVLLGWSLAALALLAGCAWAAARHGEAPGHCRLIPDHEGLRTLFTQDIPAVVIELSREGGDPRRLPSFRKLHEALGAAEIRFPGLRAAAEELLEYGSQGRSRLHSIWRARDRLNGLLHVNGIPYFVRGRVRAGQALGGGDLFYLLNYRISDCRRYRLQAARVEFLVLALERADSLNVVEQYVGATDEEETFVSVLADRIGEFLQGRLQGVLESEDVVAEAVRAGLTEALGALPAGEFEVLGPVGRFVTEGLIRHELDHRWMGINPDPPGALWRWLPEVPTEDVNEVAAEVGALLAELAFSPAYARMRIALLVEDLEDPAGRRSAHGTAGRFVLEGLFAAKLEPRDPWFLERLHLVTATLQQTASAELARRVDALHRALFGVPVPIFERVDPAPEQR